MKTVCVVGAGPSGLVTTKTLLKAGLKAHCYEMSPFIGGHWVLNNPNGRASSYRSLQTNTTKRMSRFSDFEMPAEWPDFPGQALVREWFESYAAHFALHDSLVLNTEILSAEPRENSGWHVRYKTQSGDENVKDYDALCAASGSYWSQALPAWPGEFSGTIIHAQDYIDPNEPISLKGKKLAIIGLGNTGSELACEIAASDAASVSLVVRSGHWIMPKTINGKPASGNLPMAHPSDSVPAFLRLLPSELREKLFERMVRQRLKKQLGPLMQAYRAAGLPVPPDNPLMKRPTLSDELLEHLQSKRISVRPDIEKLDGALIHFSDGTKESADVIICATGYNLRYPYLRSEIADTSDNDLNLFMGIVPPERDDLFFIGVSRPMGAFWPIAEAQAKFVAELLIGNYILPSAKTRYAKAKPMLNRSAMNPALYGLALKEELQRGRL